jgi:hypothetical protein
MGLPTVRAAVFGRMVWLAEGVVHSYRSDLFHDALWLAASLHDTLTFYWSCDQSATVVMHSDREAARRQHAYVFDVFREGSVWLLTIKKVHR